MEDVAQAPLDQRFSNFLRGGQAETEPVEESTGAEEPTEDEVEEIEGEMETQDPEDEQDITEGAEEDPQTYTVRVNGQEVRVPLDELLNGYSRTADYTAKNMAVAEARKEVEAEKQRLRAERQQYAAVLPQLEQVLSQSMGPEPDWNALYNENPAEFVRQRAAWDDTQKKLTAVQEERARMAQIQQAQQAEHMQRVLRHEQEALMSKVPDWANTETMQREQKELREYGLQMGYSEQELAGLVDHRAVLVMRDAARYRKLQAKGRATVKSGPKPVAPQGGDKGAIQGRKIKEQRAKFAKTGKVDDGLPLMREILARRAKTG